MSGSHRTLLRWLTWLLMLAGLGWVGYLLVTTIDNPNLLIPDNGIWFMLATLLLAASMSTNIFVFHAFMGMQNETRCLLSLSARLYLTGQLLRYLPGRIWGVVYQLGITRDQLPASKIVRANLDMMVYMLIGNSLVAILLLGYRLHWPPLLLMVTALCGLLVLVFLFSGGANWLLRLPAAWLPKKMGNLLIALCETRTDPMRLIWVFGSFAMGWWLYVTAWNQLGTAYPDFVEVDFLSLCAFYTLASMIGVLSTITPAGLGVREAAFIMLAGASADMKVIAFFAVFGRIWLLLVEVALLLGASGFFFAIKDKKHD